MIQEEVQDIFVERSILVRQENIARRNYKLVNWLKLLTLQEQDHNQQAVNDIIRNEIHENFVMQEHFWLAETNKRIKDNALSRQDIELLLLAFQDGHYLQVATLIAQTIVSMYKAKSLTQTFVLSVLQKIITLFDHGPKAAPFFKLIREVYQAANNIQKIRSSYERQLKLAHDDFDLVWDEYTLWQPQAQLLQANRELYSKAKSRWEKQAQEFDDNLCSDLNVKKSLINLESLNESQINQEKYLFWLEKLPTEPQKLWFLRRIVLDYRQLIQPYLLKLEAFHQSDEETLIKKYKVAIRLSQHNKNIELKYLRFLARRINRHLLNQDLPVSYSETWGEKVGFFRSELTSLIQQPRIGFSEEQSRELFKEYYLFWIEVEERMVRDKESVCQLYEKLIKQTEQTERYRDYAWSLMNLGAVKQAKNVLKRYMFHAQDQRSTTAYIQFIETYGDVEDQKQFYNQNLGQHSAPLSHHEQIPENRKEQIEISQKEEQEKNKRKEPEKERKSKPQEKEEKKENKLKRDRAMQDQTQVKIYESTRKKLHIDGDFTVFLKGIPTNWSESEVLKVLVYPDEVVRVSMVVKHNEQKDYCYIQFNSKEWAEKQVMDNKSAYKLAISKPPSEYDQSSTLFACALPATVNVAKIKQLFGPHQQSIVDVRLKLDRQKNYAYIQFQSKNEKEEAFEEVKKHPLVIDGKKIIIQHCDSSRTKNKKLMPVVFLKNLAFKAVVEDIREFFAGKELASVQIPLSKDKGKPQGFAYVQFMKFKDYQEALDMRKGTLFGRQFQILKSDRQIHHSNSHSNHKEEESLGPNKSKHHKKEHPKEQVQTASKDNNYFSNLFK